MTETIKATPDICNRLRGIYRIPITDGLGAVGSGDEPGNPNEFVRSFPAPPIQVEAAALIEQMLEMLKDCRHELGLYEADASGEHYNNPELNAIIDKLEGRP